jgi:hypothetical protein
MIKNAMAKKTKKAQMEMIGIALVVVIIIIGFLFVLKSMSKPPAEVQAGFVRAHIAQDVLNAMSIADANCGGLDMTELIKACVEGEREVACGDPCIVFRDSVQVILSSTLEKQKLPYRFRVYKQSEPPKDESESVSGLFFEYSGCNTTSIRRGYYAIKEKPGWQIIPSNTGDVKMMLEVCSKPY